ncbi:MAG: Heat shock protein 70 [Bacteroidetes bacterium]|nr:Heat shock protein 70 [Bacteroidota bacterium]
MKTINFAIDLGTTNSLIAKYTSTGVEVFKNPVGFRDTLPSCVAFRNDRIIIGDKAREWLLKDPLNVFAGFKRKMGTSETYYSPQKNDFFTPIQLSSLILSELKNFIHSQEKPESVVITIPASFDTVQSNATKKAGYEAGFKEVVLLQEPIAASLAFFNKQIDSETDGKWLVYDLGGGTFDVALIGINNGEMRVTDHQGDNYLGGLDFDHSIVMNILLPKLIAETQKTDLAEELNKHNGKYEKLYYILLLKAEDAKKELSNNVSTEIELSYDFEGNGQEKEYYIPLTRDEFNSCVKTQIDATVEMIETVVSRNQLSFSELKQIILIGGSTYIPYVRESVAQRTGLVVNSSIDPTTAVAVGAAFYAGNKSCTVVETPEEKTSGSTAQIEVQMSYNKTTKDTEEYVSAQVKNCPTNCFYRITRDDGGFDTGLKPLIPKFGEFITLRKNAINEFTFKIVDKQQNEIQTNYPKILVTHGLFNVFGQPLPEDISIEIDDLDNNTTKCQVVFERNSILPLVKTIYKEVSKTIKKNTDDHLIINLLEGNSQSHPNTNKAIGVIDISAYQLQGDLIKGSDVEIKIEMSESRDVSVSVNLLLYSQQFGDVFSPSEKHVSLAKLRDEIKEIKNIIGREISKAENAEDYEQAAVLNEKSERLADLYSKAMALRDNDLSDLKYQVDEQKRKLAQEIYSSGTNYKLVEIKEIYYSWRNTLINWLEYYDDIPKQYAAEFEALKEREITAFASNSYYQIDGLEKSQHRLIQKIIINTPSLMTYYFAVYAAKGEGQYKDYKAAKKAIERGEKALDRQNYDELKGVLLQLFGLANQLVEQNKISGTGLG